MHIILVSNRLATAKTVTLTPRLLAATVSLLVVFIVGAAFLLSWIGVRFNLPGAESLVLSVQQREMKRTEEFVRDNINAMAVRLGQMQAQVLRLDALGERVSSLTGIKPADLSEPVKPGQGAPRGQGGPLIIDFGAPVLSPQDLQRQVDQLSLLLDQRSDNMLMLESQLMERRIKATLLPTLLPIAGAPVGSVFGRRLDPFAGVTAQHEGIDFVAETGTRVIAAAGGVVISAESHPQYGKLVEIDHGNDFSSRYAHLSQIHVKPGQVVKRGQEIAASGNTGRSTGPHLHFEVRFKGVAQNPARFLQQNPQFAQFAGKASSHRH